MQVDATGMTRRNIPWNIVLSPGFTTTPSIAASFRPPEAADEIASYEHIALIAFNRADWQWVDTHLAARHDEVPMELVRLLRKRNICRRYDVRFPMDTLTIMLWTLPTSEDPRCAYCRDPDGRKLCGGCAHVTYCSDECQRSHWPVHKDRCKSMSMYGTAALIVNKAACESRMAEYESRMAAAAEGAGGGSGL